MKNKKQDEIFFSNDVGYINDIFTNKENMYYGLLHNQIICSFQLLPDDKNQSMSIIIHYFEHSKIKYENKLAYMNKIKNIIRLFFSVHQEYQKYSLDEISTDIGSADTIMRLLKHHAKKDNDKIADFMTIVEDCLYNESLLHNQSIMNCCDEDEELIHAEEIEKIVEVCSQLNYAGAIIKVHYNLEDENNEIIKYFHEKKEDLFSIQESMDLKNGGDYSLKNTDSELYADELVATLYGSTYIDKKTNQVKTRITKLEYRFIDEKTMNLLDKYEEDICNLETLESIRQLNFLITNTKLNDLKRLL